MNILNLRRSFTRVALVGLDSKFIIMYMVRKLGRRSIQFLRMPIEMGNSWMMPIWLYFHLFLLRIFHISYYRYSQQWSFQRYQVTNPSHWISTRSDSTNNTLLEIYNCTLHQKRTERFNCRTWNFITRSCQRNWRHEQWTSQQIEPTHSYSFCVSTWCWNTQTYSR